MIFRRALFNELTNSAGAVFTVLFAIVLTVGLVQILSDAVGGGVDSAAVFELTVYTSLINLPALLSVSVFVAVLMTLMRGWQDSEMVIWFSSGGLNLLSWIRPVLCFALPAVLVVAVLSLAITPWAKSQIERSTEAFQQRDDTDRVTPGTFIEASGGRRIFFIEEADPDGDKVRDIFLSERKGDREIIVRAATGEIVTDESGERFLSLSHGHRYESGPRDQPGAWRVTSFERYDLRLRARADASAVRSDVEEMPTAWLVAHPGAAAKAELLGRISWPLMALNLALLAIPLSYTNPRAGRGIALIAAVLIFILYLNGMSICQSWVRIGRMSWLAGTLALNLAVLLMTVILFARRVCFVRWIPLALTEWPRRARRGERP